MAGVAERRHADRPIGGARSRRNAGVAIAVGFGEAQAVAAVAEARQDDIAGTRSPDREIVKAEPGHLEAAQPRARIAPPRALAYLRAHRLAVLASPPHATAG